MGRLKQQSDRELPLRGCTRRGPSQEPAGRWKRSGGARYAPVTAIWGCPESLLRSRIKVVTSRASSQVHHWAASSARWEGQRVDAGETLAAPQMGPVVSQRRLGVQCVVDGVDFCGGGRSGINPSAASASLAARRQATAAVRRTASAQPARQKVAATLSGMPITQHHQQLVRLLAARTRPSIC